jgi:hypothetical protein
MDLIEGGHETKLILIRQQQDRIVVATITSAD